MPRSTSSPLENQIRVVRATLRRLDRQLRGLAPALEKTTKARMAQAVAKAKHATEKSPTRTLHLTPDRRRALKVHGQYLGYVRQLKPRQKAQVKAVKAKKGYRPAIALAKRLAAQGRS